MRSGILIHSSQHDRQLLELEVAPRNLSGSLPRLGGAGSDGERKKLQKTAAAGGAALVAVSLACLSTHPHRTFEIVFLSEKVMPVDFSV